MAEKKKRMLLFGPGYGHNVEAKLQSLQDSDLFDVVFFAYRFDESFKEKYPNINYVPFVFCVNKMHPWRSLKSIWSLYKQVRHTGKYDVLYSLGEGGLMALLIFVLSRGKTKKAIEIWNVQILNSAKRYKTTLDKMNKAVLKYADLVCQYWWGIREFFVQLFPDYEHKFLMYQLSYPDIYFSGERHEPESVFVRDFLASIPNDQLVCFWPRSIIPSNNHKLLLDSLGIIKKDNPDLMNNFKLYLWGGNVEDSKSRSCVEEAIRTHALEENVVIVDHPFVPQKDIFAIEERSDFFVQIAKDDILSTYIMEILCSGKPFVISNLRTFQFLNEKYGLKIDFVENDAKAIAERIVAIIQNIKNSNVETVTWRREECKRYFSSNNVKSSSIILFEAL